MFSSVTASLARRAAAASSSSSSLSSSSAAACACAAASAVSKHSVSSRHIARAFSSLYGWGKGGSGQIGEVQEEGVVSNKIYDAPVWSPAAINGVQGSVSSVSAGDIHTLFIENGSLYGLGTNKKSVLGGACAEGQKVDLPTRIAVEGSEDLRFKQCLASNVYSAALSEDGDVYTWGFGGDMSKGVGCLGHGSKDLVKSPQKVNIAGGDESVRFVQIAGGKKHMLALGEDGEVWSWGNGAYGKLGNSSARDQREPFPIDYFLDQDITITEIACGESHSLAVSADGDLYVWGRNMKGQLGVGGGLSMDVYAMESAPTVVDVGGRTVLHASGGVSHTCAVVDGGEVYMWGMGTWTEPHRLSVLEQHNIVATASGKNYSAAISDVGDLFTWGKGVTARSAGVLGHGDSGRYVQPELVRSLHDARTSVKEVACGSTHAVAASGTPALR